MAETWATNATEMSDEAGEVRNEFVMIDLVFQAEKYRKMYLL